MILQFSDGEVRATESFMKGMTGITGTLYRMVNASTGRSVITDDKSKYERMGFVLNKVIR